jgi:hypothetical protein
MDTETITMVIVFCASAGLVMTGYYLGKWLNEDDRPLSTYMSREWVMRNHPTNNKGEWK